MNEEEANELIAQVGSEVEEAITQWQLHGAGNRESGIHQIFTRESITGEGEGVLPNEANWTGVVGFIGSQANRLRFRSPSGEEYAEPIPYQPPRYDKTFLRSIGAAGNFDFSLVYDESGPVSMRVFIADPWGTIGGVNCANVTDPALVAGGRPFLTIPNDGNMYSVFATATCTRKVFIPVTEDMPIPDELSNSRFEYSLKERGPPDWMPTAPTYAYTSTDGTSNTYGGTITFLASGFTCMGFRSVNVAPEGEPAVMSTLFFSEEVSDPGDEVFNWVASDFTEYYTKGFDNPAAGVFDRVSSTGRIPTSGGGTVPVAALSFDCPP